MKNMLPRYCLVPAIVLALLTAVPLLRSEETTPPKEKVHGKVKEKYDTDKDGKLSETEKTQMKEDAKEKRDELKKETLEKYDANHNGKLDPEEKEKQQADRAAEKAAHRAEMEKRKAEHDAKKAERDAKKVDKEPAATAPAK